MGFPCPMCLHNPQRYEKVNGSCISIDGSSVVTIVIQHLIQHHLHSCRICAEPLVKVAKDKSVVRYKAILAEHGTCSKKQWPKENDIIKPELLSEKQQAVVLGWDRRKAAARCTSRTEGTSEEEALYMDLYMDLHGKPLREGGAKWTYLVPGHKQKEMVEAECQKQKALVEAECQKKLNAELAKVAEERASLKRKHDQLDRLDRDIKNQAFMEAQYGHGLASVSHDETERARATPFEFPGSFQQYVDPKLLTLDGDRHVAKANALLRKGLEQDFSVQDSSEEWVFSDSGYSSKKVDGMEMS